MKTIRFIGDIHGKWNQYAEVLQIGDPYDESIQVGDFGWGFSESVEETNMVNSHMMNGKHRFIRGNHDNPAICKDHPNWIIDGMRENGIFFVGGAFSIDRGNRIDGVNWWPDEELSYQDLDEMIVLYEEYKPDIVVTHDCPDSIGLSIFPHMRQTVIQSRTRNAFDTMFHHTNHKPRAWIFGHHHISVNKDIMGTKFVCLAELEPLDVQIT